ncbi:MAG: hypothetical protein FJ161_02025 [Gammaproteobacteria bacterium]|nr:hypothetical protein [Gammaproteobacteria bacterium]
MKNFNLSALSSIIGGFSVELKAQAYMLCLGDQQEITLPSGDIVTATFDGILTQNGILLQHDSEVLGRNSKIAEIKNKFVFGPQGLNYLEGGIIYLESSSSTL